MLDKLVEETKCGSVDYCKRNLTQQDFDDGGALVGNARKQFEAFIRATGRKMNSDNASKIRSKISTIKSKMRSDARKSIL